MALTPQDSKYAVTMIMKCTAALPIVSLRCTTEAYEIIAIISEYMIALTMRDDSFVVVFI
jgi:hypothetical protein